MIDLFAMVGSDINNLAELVAISLGEDLPSARRILGVVGSEADAEVFDEIDLRDDQLRKKVVLLALGADCLNRVSDAILADGTVEQTELNVAFTLVGPVAGYFAQVFDKYSRFASLCPEETADFLTEFHGDRGWFGGHPDRSTRFLGATLCYVASILMEDTTPLDAYDRTIEDVMIGVMDCDGGNSLKRVEQREVRRAKDFHKALRDTVATRSSKRPTADASSLSVNKPAQVSDDDQESPEVALWQARSELDGLVGLSGVKNEVKRLMSFLTIQQERQKHGLQVSTQSLHFVFTGNPGTGKTTVARILGNIFYGFGILKSPKMIECDRAKVVGGFLGQTAIKMDEVIQSALDGVLFVDEAYTLAGDAEKFGHGDMFGEEAINTLLKRMEDYRKRLIVIAAGYPAPMRKFLHSNPGLESRFTRFIDFSDYSVPDLCRIFDNFCRASEYVLTPEACVRAYFRFATAHAERNERFGNARFVRNAYEEVIGQHSERLAASLSGIGKADLVTIEGDDVSLPPSARETIRNVDLTCGRWEAACPSCGKVSSAGNKYLGQKVTCKCSAKFVFPWWCPIPESFPSLPEGFLVSSSVEDKRGVEALSSK